MAPTGLFLLCSLPLDLDIRYALRTARIRSLGWDVSSRGDIPYQFMWWWPIEAPGQWTQYQYHHRSQMPTSDVSTTGIAGPDTTTSYSSVSAHSTDVLSPPSSVDAAQPPESPLPSSVFSPIPLATTQPRAPTCFIHPLPTKPGEETINTAHRLMMEKECGQGRGRGSRALKRAVRKAGRSSEQALKNWKVAAAQIREYEGVRDGEFSGTCQMRALVGVSR